MFSYVFWILILESLSHLLRVETEGEETNIALIDRSYIKELSNQVRDILVGEEDGKMELSLFVKEYEQR